MVNRLWLIRTLPILSSIVELVSGFNATLYSLPNYDLANGKSENFESEVCVDIPKWFLSTDEGISGVHVKGSCVILYENFDCKGTHIIMRHGTMSHSYLKLVGFDNRAKSIGPCEIVRVETETETITQRFGIPTLLTIFFSLSNVIMFTFYLRERNIERRRRRILNYPVPPLPSNRKNSEDHPYQSLYTKEPTNQSDSIRRNSIP